MKEIRQIFAVRDGSVLLQTLVICMVLSYIAVTLTQWVLSRYTSAYSLSDTMELGSMGYDAHSHEFSSYVSACFSGSSPSSEACSGTSFYPSWEESYVIYGGIDPGPCWEGAANKHWRVSSSTLSTGSNTKTQKLVYDLVLPYDNSDEVSSCING